MNIILALLCLSLFQVAQAISLTEAISRTEGMSSQSFVLGDSPTFYKKSNFFDTKKNYVLGEFALDKKESTRSEEKVLSAILVKIRAVDKVLLAQGSSFNQLSNIEPHGLFFLVDDFRVAPGSDLYPELRKVYNALLLKKWIHREGVILSEDYTKVTTVKDGKNVESKTFDFAYACSKRRAPAYCLFKDLGILYVE